MCLIALSAGPTAGRRAAAHKQTDVDDLGVYPGRGRDGYVVPSTGHQARANVSIRQHKVAWAGSAAIEGDRLTINAANGLDVVKATTPAVPPSGCAARVCVETLPGAIARQAGVTLNAKLFGRAACPELGLTIRLASSTASKSDPLRLRNAAQGRSML